MSITTYAELKSTIADFLNRDDLTSVIDTFIDLTEADLARKVRHWRMEKRSTAILDTQYSALPSDFYEPVRLQITGSSNYRLQQMSQSDLMDYRESDNTSGRPKYYTIIDGSIEVYPSPDQDYTIEMVYYSKIIPLDATNTSNWLLQYHPDAYLYGALSHSAPYLADDGRTQLWASLYQNAISGITMEDEKAKHGGATLHMKIRSY